jgi:thioredoxin 1
MSGLMQVSADTFDAEVIQSPIPVVLDFWGPRCIPCIQIEPFVEDLRDQFAGRLKIAKVIAPQTRKLCISLKVMGLPTFLAFQNGGEVARLTGDVSRESLQQMIETLVIPAKEETA